MLCAVGVARSDESAPREETGPQKWSLTSWPQVTSKGREAGQHTALEVLEAPPGWALLFHGRRRMQLDDAGEYGWTLAAAAGRGHMHKRVPEARSLASSGAAAVSTRGAAAAWAGVARVRGDHQVNV